MDKAKTKRIAFNHDDYTKKEERNETRKRGRTNVTHILHSSFYILHFQKIFDILTQDKTVDK